MQKLLTIFVEPACVREACTVKNKFSNYFYMRQPYETRLLVTICSMQIQVSHVQEEILGKKN